MHPQEPDRVRRDVDPAQAGRSVVALVLVPPRLKHFDLGGSETLVQRIAEADARRQDIGAVPARGALVAEQAVEQTHGLKEFKPVRLLDELLDQARIESPERGSHRTSSSPVLTETSTSCTKLFSCT